MHVVQDPVQTYGTARAASRARLEGSVSKCLLTSGAQFGKAHTLREGAIAHAALLQRHVFQLL